MQSRLEEAAAALAPFRYTQLYGISSSQEETFRNLEGFEHANKHKQPNKLPHRHADVLFV